MDLSALIKYCVTEGQPLNEDQIESFRVFGETLYEQNKFMNLTRVPFEDCAARHFVDSLLISDLIPTGSKVLDLGCGPGFPSWPLACFRADLQVFALDSSKKALSFLKSMPLDNLTVIESRAEELSSLGSFDVVTGRAFAPFPIQSEVSIPLVKIGGQFIPMRTENEISTIEVFPLKRLGAVLEKIQFKDEPSIPGIRAFPIIKKTGKTASKFPRMWAEILANPLGSVQETTKKSKS